MNASQRSARLCTSLVVAALAAGPLVACDTGAAGSNAAAQDAAPAPAAATMTVDTATWELRDLNSVAPLVHLSVKLPKDAKLQQNGNGGVDVHLNDFYMLTISVLASSSTAEAIEDTKALTTQSTSYVGGTVLSQAPDGMVYTVQMPPEANGTTYEPEVHFAHFVDKEGAIYSVESKRPLDAYATPGSAYRKDVAEAIYAVVKASAVAR